MDSDHPGSRCARHGGLTPCRSPVNEVQFVLVLFPIRGVHDDDDEEAFGVYFD